METIGYGTFANVFKDKHGNAKKEFFSDCQEAALREITMLRALNRPSIIGLVDYKYTKEEQSVTMQLAKGTLHELICSKYQYGINFCQKTRDTLVNALAYVHMKGIIHRDIKPENVLVMPDGSVKLGDFSLAKFECESECHTPRCGTEEYFSPEMETCHYNQATDDYSMAIVLIELIICDFVYVSTDSILKEIAKYNSEWSNLIERLLNEKIDKRQRCVKLSNEKAIQCMKTTKTHKHSDTLSAQLLETAAAMDIDKHFYSMIAKRTTYYNHIKEPVIPEISFILACITTGQCTSELDIAFAVLKHHVIEYTRAIMKHHNGSLYMAELNNGSWATRPIQDKKCEIHMEDDDLCEVESHCSEFTDESTDDDSASMAAVNWELVCGGDKADTKLKDMRVCVGKLVEKTNQENEKE